MRDFTEAGLGILGAFLLYTLLGKISVSLLLIFNPFLLVVMYFALVKGEMFGAFTGTFCGLIQDSFSIGVFGVAGLSQTILGYLTGFVSKKINVVPISRNFVFLLIMATVELLIWALLYALIFAQRLNTGGVLLFLRPLLMALCGSLFFYIKRKSKADKA